MTQRKKTFSAKKCALCIFLVYFLCVPLCAHSLPVYTVEVLKSETHNAFCYTQGLFFYGESLYESCGLYGESQLSSQILGSNSGGTERILHTLEPQYFAEGAVFAEGYIYLLTWQENTALLFEPETLNEVNRFTYEGEGWGLAYDNERLWRSDGSSTLFVHSTSDFAQEEGAINVRIGNQEVHGLNELEWDSTHNLMLANVYGQDVILAIDMQSGQVVFALDASPLRAMAIEDGLSLEHAPYDTVLNGLALREDGLWVTGKFWPKLYLLQWPPANFDFPN